MSGSHHQHGGII